MKLHRVELSNWRSFQGDPATVVFDDRGTIVSGPNEDGKSTIFEAIRRGFFDRARTNAGWVGRLIPYGSNGLLPEVTIEFEHAGRRLRIHKRFGARGSSELCEQQAGSWVSLAANEEAEELLLGILGAHAGNQRTGSPPENWGPFQWLFVPQDLRALPAQSDATACLGMADAGLTPEFERVRVAVHHEYEQTFTSTGRVAQQSELQRAEVELSSLRDTQRTLDAEIAAFETHRHRFEEIQAALPQVRQDAAVAKTDLERIETQIADLSGSQHQLEAATERLNTARQAATRAKEILTERLRRERACAEATAAFDKAQAEHLRAQLELDQAREHFAATRLRATQAGDAIAELRRRFTAASQRLRIVQGKRAITALQDRLTRAIDLDSRIRDLSVQLQETAPDAAILAQAERLLAESRAKRDVLPNLALRVSIDGSPNVRVFADDAPVTTPEAIALKGIRIEAAGGEVLVEGNTHQAQQLADAASEQERELSTLLDRFGVASVPDLHQQREEHQRRQSELEALKRKRAAVDARSAQDLGIAIERVSAEIATVERTYVPLPELDGMSEDALKGLTDRLSAEATAQEASFEQLRTERQQLSAACESVQMSAEQTAAVLQAARTRTEITQTELDQHRDQFGSADQCRVSNETAQRDLQTAENEERDCRDRLKALENNAIVRRQTAKQKTDRLAEAVVQLEVEARQIEDTLAREAVAGTYSRLADIERRIESEERRLLALRRRAEAVKLLHTLVDEVRSDAVNSVVAPIKQDLETLLSEVTCGRYRLAQIDEHLTPVRLDGSKQCVFEDGSEGLRELVATLVRVSVAAHLAADQPQTLILDDPCAHISRDRTARLVELLNQISERGVQVVILTHRPYEFAGLIGKEVHLKDTIEGVAA